MYYPGEVIEEVRTGNDIVGVVQAYLPLRQRGGTFFGRCPFHKDKSPSFAVVSGEQYFHCFGCGAAGNVIGFIMRIENCDFVEALKFLADRIHYKLPEGGNAAAAKKNAELKERLLAINKTAARFFYDTLKTAEGAVAVRYMDERNLMPKMRTRFGLGYSSGNRSLLHTHLRAQGFGDSEIRQSGLVVGAEDSELRDKFYSRLMFPIFDAMGKVIGFGGRSLGEGLPKYLNSPETLLFNKSKSLYGLNFARLSKVRELLLVEGYMDVISLNQAGFANAVAALGTACTADHARIIKGYAESVVILFDNDEAGTKAAERAIPLLRDAGLNVRVLQTQGAKDPDEYIAAHGRDAFISLLRTAKNHVAFRVGNLEKKHDLQSAEGKIGFTRDVSRLLSGLDNAIEIDAFTREVAEMTNISEQSIRAEIERNAPDKELAAAPRRRPPKVGSGSYITEAWKKIIRIAAEYPKTAGALRAHLTAEELGGGAYARLMELVLEYHEKGREIRAAELLNHFTEKEGQDIAAAVFVIDNGDVDEANLEKVLNELVRAIKRNYIDILRKMPGDADELQKITESKRNLAELYITISDG